MSSVPPSLGLLQKLSPLSMAGHLASITSSQEQAFIANTIQPAAISRGMWIGLSDAQTESTYRWTTGESFSYSRWNTGEGQPNKSTAADDYVELTANAGLWDDQVDVAQYSILEFNSPPDLARLQSYFLPPNVVAGNTIGLGGLSANISVANVGNGIRIESSSGVVVGGTKAGASNIIASNAFNSILITGSDSVGNVVSGNYIRLI